MPIFLLSDEFIFPPPELAREDGLLAVGGDLAPRRLLRAYELGIFPWFSPGEPILWWSPSPRFVLFPDEFHIPRRLTRGLRSSPFTITMDTAFQRVMQACATVRMEKGEGTWIDARMVTAYRALHDMGYAHSIECRREGELVGGLYGVALGGVFFGESMFSKESGASKAGLVYLMEFLKKRHFDVIDCQVHTAHLENFGARMISGEQFRAILSESVWRPAIQGVWTR